MRSIKEVFSESDVTSLEPGEYVVMDGRPAMKIGLRGDGMEYIAYDGMETFTRINVRGYQICNGEMKLSWYDEEIVGFDDNGRPLQ